MDAGQALNAEAPAKEQDGRLRSNQEAETAENVVYKLPTIEVRGSWVAGGCVRPPADGSPDGIQGPRISNGIWGPQG